MVFGCGGARDIGKRREMGRIAAAMSDATIITDDNPRDEEPQKIRAEIVSGGGEKFCEIAERGEAIAAAIESAAEEDIVLIAGKGHEELQVVGEMRIPFSDAAAANAALAALSRKAAEKC